MQPEGFRERPMNIEAEQALLGAILISNDAFWRVQSILRPEHFYEPVHARIYDAMARLIEAGSLADHLTLQQAFKDDEALRELNGAQYLARMARAAETVLNVNDYAVVLVECAGRRALIDLAQEVQNIAFDGAVDESLAEQIANAKRHLATIDGETSYRPAWQSVGEVVESIMTRMSQTETDSTAADRGPISTGLRGLDVNLAGGLFPGQLYAVEARMKMGKTAIMGSVALHLMERQVPFLYVALEMGGQRIVERQIAHVTRCNAIKFRKREDPLDCLSKLRTFMRRFGSCSGYYAHEPGCRFDRLRAISAEAVNKLGIQVLLVDYLQAVTGAERQQSQADLFTAVSQWLAGFAGKNNVAVLLASQTGRSGLSFQGDGIGKACDWLAQMHKADYHDPGFGEIEVIWMDVVHNRDGPGGNIGSADVPAFWIDKKGPVVRDFGDWDPYPDVEVAL